MNFRYIVFNVACRNFCQPYRAYPRWSELDRWWRRKISLTYSESTGLSWNILSKQWILPWCYVGQLVTVCATATRPIPRQLWQCDLRGNDVFSCHMSSPRRNSILSALFHKMVASRSSCASFQTSRQRLALSSYELVMMFSETLPNMKIGFQVSG